MAITATRRPYLQFQLAAWGRRVRAPLPWDKKTPAQEVGAVNPFFSGMLIGISITVALIFLTSSIDLRQSAIEPDYYVIDAPQ